MRSPVVLVRLAERYAHYLSEPTPNAYLAWERLGQIIRALDPAQAFDLACHLVRTLPRPYLPTFGGGALAHLVDYHGAALIDWIEREALRDADFRTALAGAWVAGEGVHPTMLIRLRIAAGARLHIARRPKRDAIYQAMFEGWATGHQPRAVRHPRRTDVTKELLRGKKVPSSVPSVPSSVILATRVSMRLLAFQLSLPSKPHYLRDMVRGAVAVWLPWFYLTAIAARFWLPVLVVVLCINSASPVTDLMLVALAFVLATVGAAVAGVVIGMVGERHPQLPRAPLWVSLVAVIPYATLIGLIARGEHGVFVAPAVVAALVARPYVWGFVRRAWTAAPSAV